MTTMNNNRNLYPVAAPGSFDDYDSISGFSIGGRSADSDDVSSMHMSEMGGASLVAAGAGPSPSVSPARRNAVNKNSTHGVIIGGGGGNAAAQFAPAARAAEDAAVVIQPRVPSVGDSPQRSVATLDSLKLGSDNSGYYHVGDLGIDATDVSAILGHAASVDQDEESLLAQASSLPSVAAAKNDAAFAAAKGDSIWERTNTAHTADVTGTSSHSGVVAEVSGHRARLGPLGDELSYAADSADFDDRCKNKHVRDINADDGPVGEGEEDDVDGLLPDWIATSSRRVKFVFVVSTALVLGSLVLAVVALGVSYGTGTMNGGDGNGIGASSAVDHVGGAPGSGGVRGNANSFGAADEVVPTGANRAGPTEYPTMITGSAPVSSTTREEEAISIDPSSPPTATLNIANPTTNPTTAAPTSSSPSTSSPTDATFQPTLSFTATSDILDFIASSNTLPPTRSPREGPTEEANIEAASVAAVVAPTYPPTTDGPTFAPTTKSPTTNPSSSEPTTSPSFKPTVSPSSKPTLQPAPPLSTSPSLRFQPSSVPTATSVPTTSSAPTMTPSIHPTTTSRPTSFPSASPAAWPSLVPTESGRPSWSFGEDALKEGDATFYLMADGGSNWKFWTDKLERLDTEQHKFLVHLGSATRVVDDCASTAYYRTQLSLSHAPVPVYSIPGNNDWPKCNDPTEGWQYYRSHLMDIDAQYWNATADYDVKRQAPARPENFSFVYRKVLFVGLHMVTNSDVNETSSRLEENIEWVVSNVDEYRDHVDAVFVMGYGRLLAPENVPFYEAMVTRKQTDWKDKLLVYARRASESDMTKNVGGVKDFVELKVGNEWPIMDVRVRTRGRGIAVVEYRDVLEANDDDDDDDAKDEEEV